MVEDYLSIIHRNEIFVVLPNGLPIEQKITVHELQVQKVTILHTMRRRNMQL